jgi:hypothetical protein
MSKKKFPFFLAFIVLIFSAMACACLGSGSGITGFQATANAVLTQVGAAGSSLVATANAASTQDMATANASGGTTGGQATPTTGAGGAATAAPTSAGGGGSPASGGPSDIPLVDSAQNTVQLATDKLLTYETKADFATAVKFYKDAMPKNGWTADATTTVETPNASVLAFTKGSSTAQISITPNPADGQTVVVIVVS